MQSRSRSRRNLLSQPRRRRRRRRGSGPPSESKASEQKQPQQSSEKQGGAPAGRRRRRRGRPRGEGKRPSSPKSSEDLVRSLPKERPATLTAPADGQTLEGIIGELQSQYGVPQYPQEYRITIKVADEREQRSEPQQPSNGERKQDGPQSKPNGPRREKAPSAPVLMREGSDAASPNKKRRRGRRGRRRRGGSGGGNGTGSAPSS